MRIYQVPICSTCKEQADWNSDYEEFHCSSDGQVLTNDQVEWIECIPLYAEDDD